MKAFSFTARLGTAVAMTALAVGVAVPVAQTQAQTQINLTVESWRSDDRDLWTDKILPLYMAKNKDVTVTFTPTTPTEYNAALNAKLAGGTAGDLITCRPFDASLELYKAGHLASLNDLEGLKNYSDVAKSAWTTDDGAVTFCLPMASVIHGFFYNKEAFEEVGVEVPNTLAEFKAVLDKFNADGTYTPLAMGTNDQWEAATMGFQNVGPNFWKGEEGRRALLDGSAKLTDAPYVATFAELADWNGYLGRGFKAQSYSDSQNLFSLGRAAIYPAGSWDIATFRAQAMFEFGAFKPPVPRSGDECYISDHTDIGIGINAKSPNMEAAKAFLNWMASKQFAEVYANAVPGFFPLADYDVTLKDDVAQEMVSWRKQCKSTIRNTYQILSRGTPNLETELWNASVQVINGSMSPQDAAAKLQDGLEKWYAPQQN